ncbi:MAG: efflux RND transporter permease subunit [Planctomycetota bacterium]
MTDAAPASSHSWINRIVEVFVEGPFSILLILLSLVAGAFAVLLTPREEDPQIVVPIANVLVSMPGASVSEVERQVATRLEKLLYQIDGIEYVYSTSVPGRAIVTARFFVGEDREQSWVRLHNKILANIDQVPPGVTGWVVKPVEIDDVPICTITLCSATHDDFELRRMAEELEIRVQAVEEAGRTYIIGGRPRELTLTLDPDRMAARHVDLDALRRALAGASESIEAGSLVNADTEMRLRAGRYLHDAEEVRNLVVAVREGRPVYMRDVVDVRDGPAEPECYTRIAFGPAAWTAGDVAHDEKPAAGIHRYTEVPADYPAVSVAVAKRKGSNAVWVSEAVQRAARDFADEVLPAEVYLRVTRDYGETANDKVNELLESLFVAIIIVVALLAWTLGLREGLIIALAVPITFSLTLLVNLLLGYTINRVTLFALILALGLVVDDPIVDVENIHRHLETGRESRFRAVLRAVNEVRPPIILATLAVIISFVPMFFITGMMGPYMAPMALNVPVAMLMSLLVAFTITPWLCYKTLREKHHEREEDVPVLEHTRIYRFYQAVLLPLLSRRLARWSLLGLIVVLLGFSGWLVLDGRVPLKMLPFDNKNEFQVVIDMPEATTLERTEAVAADLARYLVRFPEVTDVTWYAGTASPVDFNGLVRQYTLREGPSVADVRVSVIHKKHREQQSHAMTLRVRRGLEERARQWGAAIKIVEVPPGPPVVATLVAEVRGGPEHTPQDLGQAARRVRHIFERTAGVVDVDDTLVAPQVERRFRLDREKAASLGITETQAAAWLDAAFAGATLGALRLDDEVRSVKIVARLPRSARQRGEEVEPLYVTSAEGAPVPLAELGDFEESLVAQPIHHKNLDPLVYVFGETAGRPPAEAIFEMQKAVAEDAALAPFHIEWAGEGEWKITLDVFRDLGIAFGVAVLGIYMLLVYQTRSYLMPLVLLIAIPLTIIGIVPGFFLLNVFTGNVVDGFPDPVFFTATGMIGMIALAGIATRNAILLMEFVEEARRRGTPMQQALIEAGALRTRPICLTAGTALLAAWPITLDPIFSGLAWALILGLLVSTVFTLAVVPVVYAMIYGRGPGAEAIGGES